nr:endoplasmic reticulum metallopeptidase 1 [Ipomoea batatas]
MGSERDDMMKASNDPTTITSSFVATLTPLSSTYFYGCLVFTAFDRFTARDLPRAANYLRRGIFGADKSFHVSQFASTVDGCDSLRPPPAKFGLRDADTSAVVQFFIQQELVAEARFWGAFGFYSIVTLVCDAYLAAGLNGGFLTFLILVFMIPAWISFCLCNKAFGHESSVATTIGVISGWCIGTLIPVVGQQLARKSIMAVPAAHWTLDGANVEKRKEVGEENIKARGWGGKLHYLGAESS